MREINVETVREKIALLCREANFSLPEDVLAALQQALAAEQSPAGRQALEHIIENARLAGDEQLAICQDCGAAVVYLDIGQDLHIAGGDLYEAVNNGVRQGYDTGYLRKSMVTRPFSARLNTKDNTPAVIHTVIVPGDKLKITVVPKGGGSENMSRLFMLPPSAGRRGIIESVVKSVEEAGSNPCPPIIVGVGIGGTAEKAMDLARGLSSARLVSIALTPRLLSWKKSCSSASIPWVSVRRVTGTVTALGVNVEIFPAHIASMPLAVNLQCHAARHKEAVI